MAAEHITYQETRDADALPPPPRRLDREHWLRRENMHPNRVLAEKGLTAEDKLVYMALDSFCFSSPDGICSPSRETLSSCTALGVRTITRCLAHLEGHGWLEKAWRTGAQAANVYHLTGPRHVTVPEGSHPTSANMTALPAPTSDTLALEAAPPSLEVVPCSPPSSAKQAHKEDSEENKATPTSVGVAAGDDGHERREDAQSDQRDRAERLCSVLEIEPTSENVREMAGVVDRWAGRCEAATDLTLEEMAFDCRQWLSDPARNKGHRKSTVTFFRNTWLIRDVKKAEAARAVPLRDERSTGNGEHRGRSRADEATHAAAGERRDAEHDRRLARHLARGGTEQSFYGL